jgi:hypothetical protein
LYEDFRSSARLLAGTSSRHRDGGKLAERQTGKGVNVDFGFSEEQEMLRQSARGLLEKECLRGVVTARSTINDDRLL